MKKKLKLTLIAFAACLGCIQFNSCEKEETADSKVPDQELYHDDIYKIPVQGTWISSNNNIASVENNIVRGVTIGTANIKNGSNEFKVTVKPRYNYFSEPYMGWGQSMSEVKSNVKGYELEYEFGEMLVYTGNNKESEIVYYFEEGKLNTIGVMIDEEHLANTPNLIEFLKERYINFYVTDDESIMFLTTDNKVLGMLAASANNDGVVVFYGPYNGGNKKIASSAKAKFRALAKKIK